MQPREVRYVLFDRVLPLIAHVISGVHFEGR